MLNIKVIPVNYSEMTECDCQFAGIPNLGDTVVIDSQRVIVFHRDLLPCKDSDSIAAHVFVRKLFEQESNGLPKSDTAAIPNR
jgi:hypothetical protein